MLNNSTLERLEKARQNQLLYRPNEDIANELRTKTLVMIVAPTACGKSYLMERITHLNPDCQRVIDITSRDPRPDDPPGAFSYIPYDDHSISQFLDRIDRRELVQYAIHPTTNNVYGSALEGYTVKYNFLETLSSAVMTMRRLPFRRAIVIGIAVELHQWQEWFNTRFPRETNPEERQHRLEEAILSLEWLMDPTHPDLVHWVENSPTLDATSEIINIVKHDARTIAPHATAQAMLDWAKSEVNNR